MLNPEKIWHEHLTDLSTSPVRCSHFTLGNPKESFFNICVHTHTHAHTHTHTTCLTALCPGLPGSAGTEKKKKSGFY